MLPSGMEWIIILVIVIIIFGPSRLGKIFSEMGNAIRQFREGLGGDKDKKEEEKKDETPKA